MNTPTRFYYCTSYDPPEEFLDGRFPLLVLDPGCNRGNPEALNKLRERGSKTILAYTAAVEMREDSRFWKKAKNIPKLGINPDWGSWFMKVDHPDWAKFFSGTIAADAKERGFDGIVLDTFDMYVDIVHRYKLHDNQARLMLSMAELVALVRKQHGDEFLIVPNRGFEIWEEDLAEFQKTINGMLVESYRTGDSMKWVGKRIKWVLKAGKPVLVMEYTADVKKAKAVTKENRLEGMPTLVCASRRLTPPEVVWYPGKRKE